MATTPIEWTATVNADGSVTKGKVWNPVTGCHKVSPGCKNCYAATIARRLWATQYPPVPIEARGVCVGGTQSGERPRKFEDVQTHEDRLLQPFSWKKPCKVFVNSMSDLFEENVPFEFIDQVFAVMGLNPHITFQVLTKRAERMREYASDTEARRDGISGAIHSDFVGPGGMTHDGVEKWCKKMGLRRAERERRLGVVNDGGGRTCACGSETSPCSCPNQNWSA